MITRNPHVVARVTAALLIAQQVGGSAIRDGLLLSLFKVQTVPYFMAGAAVLAMVATQLSGRLLTRLGPPRAVPMLVAGSAMLFVGEWLLLAVWPPATAVLLYLHSSVLGGIVISSFWSLLNERFDPHSAKPLMARVAAAATLGGFVGGVGAERVAALLPEGALLPLLAMIGAGCMAGVVTVGRGAPPRRGTAAGTPPAGAWAELQQQPLLRNLAMVVVLGAVLSALVDYLLKAEAVAYFGRGHQLVRFFALFYAGTGLGAVLVQTMLGRVALGRLGLGGSVASHSAIVGTTAVLGFLLPPPWRGFLPRGCDVVVRNSTFRAGYELLYTPLAEAAKRSVKSLIDVAFDCAGKGAGALLILLLTPLAATHSVAAVNIAAAGLPLESSP